MTPQELREKIALLLGFAVIALPVLALVAGLSVRIFYWASGL